MKQGSGAAHRAPLRARNRTRLVKTAAEPSACLNIKTRYGDVTLKNFEIFIVFYRILSYFIVFYRILTYFIVFDHIWLVLIDRERSRKVKKKTNRSRTINNDQKKQLWISEVVYMWHHKLCHFYFISMFFFGNKCLIVFFVDRLLFLLK